MKTQTLIATHEVVGSIRAMYRRAGPCHCHTVAKLGEQEVLEYLLRRRVIQVADLHDARGIPINMLEKGEGGTLSSSDIWRLQQHHVRYLPDLTGFRLSDLINMQGIGQRGARRIELIMAQFGLLLKDGDPAILKQVKTDDPLVLEPLPEPDARSGQLSPDELRQQAVDALFKIAKTVFDDGQFIMSAAAKLVARPASGRNSSKLYVTSLRKYGESSGRAAHEEVRRLMAPVVAAEGALDGLKKVTAEEGRERLRDLGDKHPNVVDLRKTATA